MAGVVVELFLVMGLTWLADVASLIVNWRSGRAYAGWEILVFDLLNSLQGVLIFLVLVCKPRVRRTILSSLGWSSGGKAGAGVGRRAGRLLDWLSPAWRSGSYDLTAATQLGRTNLGLAGSTSVTTLAASEHPDTESRF